MRAKKVDENQPLLVKQMRKIPGLKVFLTHTLGNGFGDAVLGFRKNNYIIEIKDPAKPPSARKLTPDEEKFHEEWTGQITIVETIDDVLNLLNLR